jgi:protein-S-isoprenylcysteine O-methyltransferase Ste14
MSPAIANAMFWAAAAALVTLNLLLLLTIFSKSFKLWPTPGKGSWQQFVFWPLFRGGLGLTLACGALTLLEGPWPHWPLIAIGAPMAAIGLGFTIYGYLNLGLENTYGSDDGLVTTGLYRYSRNPQYVASIVGFAGLALMGGSPALAMLCGLAVLVYMLLPFAEEPWLARIYGDAYHRYRASTPRFLSVSKFRPDHPN